jgi:hypothetical protein
MLPIPFSLAANDPSMSFEAFAITSFKVWLAITMLELGGDAIVVVS